MLSSLVASVAARLAAVGGFAVPGGIEMVRPGLNAGPGPAPYRTQGRTRRFFRHDGSRPDPVKATNKRRARNKVAHATRTAQRMRAKGKR